MNFKKNTAIIFLLFLFIHKNGVSQNNYQIATSGHYVSFGSGDFLGYGISFLGQKEFIKNKRLGIGGLKIGGEVSIDLGNKGTLTESNESTELFRSFYSVSMTNLWLKASYYPFHKVIPGFHISLGPTIGYSSLIFSDKYSVGYDPLKGKYTKQILSLYHEKGFTYGYRLSVGYDFELIDKKFLIGLRTDFYNNNLGDINSTLGLKFGYNFTK